MEYPKLSIIIPTYNEALYLPTVLQKLKDLSYPDKEIIVVDDASQDETQLLLNNLVREGHRLQVIRHSCNCGKGAAIRTGLKYATGELVIIQDGDLEYDPTDILRVIQPILDGETEVSYGSRFLGRIEGMKLANYIANKLLAWWVSFLFHTKITDEATAYKAFRRAVINSLDLQCRGFEFCPEVTAKALRRGYKILEVPVSFRARAVWEGKKIGLRDFFIALGVIFKYRFFWK